MAIKTDLGKAARLITAGVRMTCAAMSRTRSATALLLGSAQPAPSERIDPSCDSIGHPDFGASAEPIDLDFTADERLFGISGTDWRATAALAGTTTDVVPYVSGFREAGDMLISQGIETGMQDFIAFPALYCYRHALELALKDVVYESERAKTGEFEVIRTHDLHRIWRRTRAVLEATWPDGDAVQLERMGRAIEELAAVDPGGEQFRYDRDREGFVRDIPEELMRFDLRIVETVAGKLIALMQGAVDGISERRTP